MLGVFNTIIIDGMEFYRPSDFNLTRTDVFEGEYTAMTGNIYADRIGWKYADMTLKWDTLPQTMLDKLTSLSGAFNLTFTDSDGTHTELVVRGGFENTPTRMTAYDGAVLWKDVNVQLRFLNVHND